MKNWIAIGIFLFASVGNAQTSTEKIVSQNRSMENAFREGNMVAIAEIYSKNAAIVGPRTEVIGEEAVANYWKGLEERAIDWKLENISITEYEDVAIQRGISHLTFYHNDTEVTSVVRFTLVWIQEDGQWKISVDHYSPL